MTVYHHAIQINVLISRIIEYFPSTIYIDSNCKDIIIIDRKKILKLMNTLMKSLRTLLRKSVPGVIIKSIITNMNVLNVIQKIYIPMFKNNTLSFQPRLENKLFTIDEEFDAYYTITLVNDLYNTGVNTLKSKI